MADADGTNPVPKRPTKPTTSNSHPLLDGEQVAAIMQGLEAGFGDDPAAVSGVAIVMGSGAKVRVHDGRLCIEDGEGWHRRTREWGRVSDLRRLIISAQSGYVSLAVFEHCRKAGVEVVIVDDDGEILLAPAGGATDGRVRRVQAAPPPGLAVEAARLLLRPKLRGQASVLRDLLADAETAKTLAALADALDGAEDVDACRQLEASGAAAYFSTFIDHPATTLRFARADAAKVPAHWAVFDGRRSLLSKGVSARKAERPLNALLNAGYHFGAIATRSSLIATGVDPALPFVHADQRNRDACVFDVLETIRPTIDRWTLTLIAERTFTRRDFYEMSDGSVKIAPKLVQECAAAMPLWARSVAPHAEALAHLLGRAVVGKWHPTTTLTGNKARMAQAQVKARKIAAARASAEAPAAQAKVRRTRTDQSALFANCLRCGGQLGRSRHLYCQSCQDQTPGHARDTRRRRGQAIAATRAELERWKAEHPDDFADPEQFRREILPGLATVTLREIMTACVISKTSASTIRSGKHVPAHRHWAKLAALASGQSSGSQTAPAAKATSGSSEQ